MLALATFSISERGATAQPVTPREALARLFTSEQIDAGWFTQEFLAQVSVAQIQGVIASLTSALGTFEDVEDESGGQFTVRFSGGFAPARISLNEEGRIQGLFFSPPRPTAAGPEPIAEELGRLPGQVSVLVTENGQDRVAINADRQDAVGSTFKLAVLATLQEQIAAGQRSWDDVVAMQDEWKSLPTGVLQDWPAGTPLTLATIAALMISRSDNTATDALIDIVGRENVERLSGQNRPLLTTREFFALKHPANSDLLDRYRAGGESERRAVLAEVVSRPLPGPEAFEGGPVVQDIEWFFSVRDLCGLMERVAGLPLMSINPGLVNPLDWARVSYKGGSEPGVLNVTTWLEAKDGRRMCVSATWNNNAALDEDRFFLLVGGLRESLK
jgi:beta-lactamase class A